MSSYQQRYDLLAQRENIFTWLKDLGDEAQYITERDKSMFSAGFQRGLEDERKHSAARESLRKKGVKLDGQAASA